MIYPQKKYYEPLHLKINYLLKKYHNIITIPNIIISIVINIINFLLLLKVNNYYSLIVDHII